MNCERLEHSLVAYMDGRATEAERIEVDRHLLACAACRTRVEEFSQVWKTLADAPAPQVSSAFDARLRARIAAEPPRGWLAWLPAPRLALAAALLLLLSVWVGGDRAIDPNVAMNPGPATEEDVRAVKDLQTLEDLDVLANFEALAELPRAPQS